MATKISEPAQRQHAGDDAGSATVPERSTPPPGAAPGQHMPKIEHAGILGWIYRCCYLHTGYETQVEARRSLQIHLAGPLHADR